MRLDRNQQATRQRLLEAAGETFARFGYRAATVREICRRAGTNIASINYHFGDKERLYAEVVQYAHASSLERHPYTTAKIAQAGPVERLNFFIESYMRRL